MISSSEDLSVSRETISALRRLEELLQKWNQKINLVSKSTLDQTWKRHIVDSAQIFDLIPSWRLWADLGSGGGFPGLVVAILAKEKCPETKTVLVESDRRKAVFLRTAIRDLELSATVHSERIENLNRMGADVVSARALADLPLLLYYASGHLREGGSAVFLKGSTWKQEVETARKDWLFSLAVHESKTDPAAAILEIKDIRRV
jgi:16S rRNA (guanine527-N7)-methyltransferase